MKAIILAAGKWTRLRPLTNTTPKPLIKIFWKTIIEHNLKNIYKNVSEIIIIVKYLEEKIKNNLWDNYKWVPITYKTQGEEKWTWAALRWLNIKDDVLILNWDSIFDKDDLKNIIKHKWYSVLVQEVENPEKYGIFEVDENNFAKKVVEKPEKFVWNLANLWVYKFGKEIFDIVEKIELSPRWEYELTDWINEFLKKEKLKTIKIKWNFIDVWHSWDILDANSYFLKNLEKSKIKWKVEENVVIKWNIVLEKWAILKSGTYIEWNCYIWKNTIIWPNTYLRWETCIWDNCKIWNAVEVKNSTFWDNSNSAHLSYIWDSVIWNNVNLGWGFITANLRHDNKNIRVMVKWELVDSWKRKLGVIIWDNVKTWIKTMTMPWRIIENDNFTMPWEVVK